MSVEPNVEIEQGDMFARVTMSYTPDQLDALAQRVAENWEQEVESSVLSRLGYVRVVRCRDCANATECEDGTLDCHGRLVQTWDYWNDEPLRNPVPPDGFCAWGKRREVSNA